MTRHNIIIFLVLLRLCPSARLSPQKTVSTQININGLQRKGILSNPTPPTWPSDGAEGDYSIPPADYEGPADSYEGPTETLQLINHFTLHASSSGSPVVVTLTQDSSFQNMGDYVFTVSSLTFQPSTPILKLSGSLIISTLGKLIFSKVTFEGITLATKPLLTITESTTVTLSDGVLFKGITRTAVDADAYGGSVIELTGLRSKFVLEGATFDDCNSPEGKGGAIYIGVSHTPEGYLTIKLSLTFKNVNSKAAKSGLCTYIDFVPFSKGRIGGDWFSTQVSYFRGDGYHTCVTSDVSTPINLYALFESLAVVIDHTEASQGSDAATCGSSAAACLSFEKALRSNKFNTFIQAGVDYKQGIILYAPGTHAAESVTSQINNDLLVLGATPKKPKDTVLIISSIEDMSSVFLIVESDLKVEIFDITYMATEASSTGVFELIGKSILSLENVRFENSDDTIAYSTPVINAAYGILTLSKTVFENILLTTCSLLKISTEKDRCNFEDTVEFVRITRESGNGAILEETLSDASELLLPHTGKITVTLCTSEFGAIFFNPYSQAKEYSLQVDLDNIIFSSGDADQSEANCLIGFTASDITIIKEWMEKIPEDESSLKKFYGTISTVTGPLIYFMRHPYEEYYISTTATPTANTSTCGWKELPCGTFEDVFDQDYIKVNNFCLLEGSHSGTEIDVASEDTFDLRGTYTPNKPDEPPTLHSLYAVSNDSPFHVAPHANLSVTYLSLEQTGPIPTIQSHVFESSGTLLLDHLEFHKIDLSRTTLICVPELVVNNSLFTSKTPIKRELTFTNITFKSVSLVESNKNGQAGSLFSFDFNLTPGDDIPIDVDPFHPPQEISIFFSGITFDSCQFSSGGVGGVAYIKFPYTLENITLDCAIRPFRGAVSTQVKGKYIYFDLSALEDESDEDFLETFDSSLRNFVADATPNECTVKTKAGTEKDLYTLLGVTKLELTVDAATSSAIEDAINQILHHGTSSGNTITVASSTLDFSSDHASDTTYFTTCTKDVAISGSPTQVVLGATLNNKASLLTLDTDSRLSLSSFAFAFDLYSTHSSSTTVVRLSGYQHPELTLSEVTFTSNTENKQAYLHSPIIDAENGQLILSSVTMSYLTITGSHSLLHVSGRKGAFSIQSTTTFSNIIKNNGAGSVISRSVDAGGALEIENADFISCIALNGNGGALDIAVHGAGNFSLKNCSFTACRAGSASGHASNADQYRGGGVYLSVDSSSGQPSVVFESLTVSDCKASAQMGGNVIFCEYIVAEGETVPEIFWENMMVGVVGAVKEDFYAIVHLEDIEDPIERFSLAKFASEPHDDYVFPLWAIVLILVLTVLTVAAIVVAVLAYVFKCCAK